MHISVIMPSGNIYRIRRDYTGSLNSTAVLNALKDVRLEDLIIGNRMDPEDVDTWGLVPIRVMVEVKTDLQGRPITATIEPSSDGLGHSAQDSCVEDTLRELLASEKGSDKHEALMKKYLGEGGEKVLLNLMARDFYSFHKLTTNQIKDLQERFQHLNTRFNAQTTRLRMVLAPEDREPPVPDNQKFLDETL